MTFLDRLVTSSTTASSSGVPAKLWQSSANWQAAPPPWLQASLSPRSTRSSTSRENAFQCSSASWRGGARHTSLGHDDQVHAPDGSPREEEKKAPSGFIAIIETGCRTTNSTVGDAPNGRAWVTSIYHIDFSGLFAKFSIAQSNL